ncbi:MAG: anti-sigma factor antagonist [Armatimonadia bacterium]|nr:anti-sigma factor antagonist [Armatimonadia bacterium]
MALDTSLETADGTAKITLAGELDASVAGQFQELIKEAAEHEPTKVVLFVENLSFMASAGLRVLVFAKQHMGSEVDIYMIAPQEPIRETLEMSGFASAVYIQDTYEE